MPIRIIILICACLLVLGVGAAWYVQSLRLDNAALTQTNAKLRGTLAANQAVVVQLQAQAVNNDALIAQWTQDQAKLKQLQTKLNQQIQKEMQNNEDFNNWGSDPYNADALRLLRTANSNRVSDD